MINFSIDAINFDKLNGLIPACIQDQETKEVLMLGFMNKEALEQTISIKRVVFFSRTKQQIWLKGETSGHYLEVQSIFCDCDEDTLLIWVKPLGPTCHLGNISCFQGYSEPSLGKALLDLQQIIQSRIQLQQEGYTTHLFQAGLPRIAQKIGEEGVEVALAAVTASQEEVVKEIVDLLYHLLVLMVYQNIPFSALVKLINARKKA